MTRLMAAIALGAAVFIGPPLRAQPASQRTADAVDPCAAAGDARFKSANKSRCEGFWNIYAAIPGGGVWWFDNKMGDNPKGNAIDKEATSIQEKLKDCGVTANVSLSDWFDNFTGDLVVVHSAPYPSRGKAAAQLAKGRACGFKGYTKFSPYQFAGQD